MVRSTFVFLFLALVVLAPTSSGLGLKNNKASKKVWKQASNVEEADQHALNTESAGMVLREKAPLYGRQRTNESEWGWPPQKEGKCAAQLGYSWGPSKPRFLGWINGNKKDNWANFSCCGFEVPHGTHSYAYSGGGCRTMIGLANFMEVVDMVRPAAQLYTSVSGSNWYGILEQYGNLANNEKYGSHYYDNFNWNTSHYPKEKVDAHMLGYDRQCTQPSLFDGFLNDISAIFLNLAKPGEQQDRDQSNHTGAQAWDNLIGEVFLQPFGIDPRGEFGQLVPTSSWAPNLCADWIPVAAITKVGKHSGVHELYNILPFDRKGQFRPLWDLYSTTSIQTIMGAASNIWLNNFVSQPAVLWRTFCDKMPNMKKCVTNPNVPPQLFADMVQTFTSTPRNLHAVMKTPFVTPGSTLNDNNSTFMDCPAKPATIVGKLRKSMDKGYEECAITDAVLFDTSGVLASVVSRELTTWSRPFFRRQNQAKIHALQAISDLESLRVMLNVPICIGQSHPEKDAQIATFAGEMITGDVNKRNVHTLKQPDHWDICNSEKVLQHEGLSMMLAFVIPNYDMGVRGDYSVLLQFASLDRNDYSDRFLSRMPEEYKQVAKDFNFPEYPNFRSRPEKYKEYHFTVPEPAAKMLAIFGEFHSNKWLGVHRWSDMCWTYLKDQAAYHKDWYSAAMCLCVNAPMYGTLTVDSHDRELFQMDDPWKIVEFWGDQMNGINEGENSFGLANGQKVSTVNNLVKFLGLYLPGKHCRGAQGSCKENAFMWPFFESHDLAFCGNWHKGGHLAKPKPSLTQLSSGTAPTTPKMPAKPKMAMPSKENNWGRYMKDSSVLEKYEEIKASVIELKTKDIELTGKFQDLKTPEIWKVWGNPKLDWDSWPIGTARHSIYQLEYGRRHKSLEGRQVSKDMGSLFGSPVGHGQSQAQAEAGDKLGQFLSVVLPGKNLDPGAAVAPLKEGSFNTGKAAGLASFVKRFNPKNQLFTRSE